MPNRPGAERQVRLAASRLRLTRNVVGLTLMGVVTAGCGPLFPLPVPLPIDIPIVTSPGPDLPSAGTPPATAPPTTAPAPTTAPTTTAPATIPPPTTAPAAPAAPALNPRVGFAEGSSLLWLSDSELTRRLDGIKEAGAGYLRVDVDWALVQPSRDKFDWSRVDRVINGARARGLNVLGLLTYTPAWARPANTSNKHPPTNPADFAAFARAAVARYAPQGVRVWEIWNEPNSYHFWSPKPNATAYTALLKPAYAAIKSADAGATVMTGGFSPAPDATDGTMIAPVTFLKGVYAAGGAGHFDAVAHHPYNYPYMPTRPETNYNWNAFAGVTPKLYETMVANGDGTKKIWGTEMGAPTVNGSTYEYLAAYVKEAYTLWRSWSFTGPLFWYSYCDAGTDPTDREDNFGLVRADFTPKEPALTALKVAARS